MKILMAALFALLIGAAGCSTGHASGTEHGAHTDNNPRPFDETANARHDVDATLLAAKASGKNALLVFGGNWCHDSRGIAAKFEREPLKQLIADHYELAWIDVGHRDRNLDVLESVGVSEIFGTPTVVILSPDGELLNADSVHDWRTADSISFDDTLSYFQGFAAKQ